MALPLIEGTAVVALAERVDTECTRGDDVSPLILEALAYEVIAFAAREPGRESESRPRCLQQVKDFIQAESQATIRMTDLARVANVHPAHLARIFRDRLGMTPGDYVRQVRVRRGAELLKDSELSIAEVALRCDFYDQSHFSRTFKRVLGITPRQYRRRAKSF